MTKEKKVNTALSYSSGNLLINCEQKYWHHKVGNTPGDADCEDDYAAFDIGKTFHGVLEQNMHTRENLEGLLDIACKEYKTEDNALMIKAMICAYLDMHEASGLKCIKCELQISSKEVIGFIDAFMVDSRGYWYICDLKTTGMWRATIVSRLASDPQLNLYSHFAEKIAPHLDLDPKKFKGCLYRVATKTKISQKSNESDNAFFNRLYKTVKAFDIFVPVEAMCIEETWERHLEAYERSIELRNGMVPKKNFSYCESYFKPCKWWSHCHGEMNSKCGDKVTLNTAGTYNRKNELILDVL